MARARELVTDRPYSYRLRQAVKDGTAQVLECEPKDIWMYSINRGGKT